MCLKFTQERKKKRKRRKSNDIQCSPQSIEVNGHMRLSLVIGQPQDVSATYLSLHNSDNRPRLVKIERENEHTAYITENIAPRVFCIRTVLVRVMYGAYCAADVGACCKRATTV